MLYKLKSEFGRRKAVNLNITFIKHYLQAFFVITNMRRIIRDQSGIGKISLVLWMWIIQNRLLFRNITFSNIILSRIIRCVIRIGNIYTWLITTNNFPQRIFRNEIWIEHIYTNNLDSNIGQWIIHLSKHIIRNVKLIVDMRKVGIKINIVLNDMAIMFRMRNS